MGAIEHEGYRFEIEYSVLLQKGRCTFTTTANSSMKLCFPFAARSPMNSKLKRLSANMSSSTLAAANSGRFLSCLLFLLSFMMGVK
ncbi:DUF5370 family protein [Geobacillus jurassicus]|uniref:DUF5370 family protein n=1 Tax=Geobacillus jurassicus TaxID=235932 RepID=UPI0035715EF8